MTSAFGPPFTILLAEDDEGHARLIIRNLRRTGVENDVVHVTDGQQVLDFLSARPPYENRPPLSMLLLLLDINMPRMNGIEVLRQVKSDPELSKIPVVMLTTTDDPWEIERCYELGCNVYVSKPVDHEAFVEALKRLGLFLQIVKLPPERTHPRDLHEQTEPTPLE